MIILLSPAKTIEKEPVVKDVQTTTPIFLKESQYLANKLRSLSLKELQALYGVSNELARLNYERLQFWEKDFANWPYNPALLAFKGEVYRGIEAWNFSEDELNRAQKHLLILSGLYGILRPLDNIQAYRLEMGSNLMNRRGKNLYHYWTGVLTKELKRSVADKNVKTIINLASKEYSKAIDLKRLNVRVIEIIFKDFSNGSYKFLTAYGKHARGMMTRFIITNKLKDSEEIKAFDMGGYHLNSDLTEKDSWVFTRG